MHANLSQARTSIILVSGSQFHRRGIIYEQSAHGLKQWTHFSVCLALQNPWLVDASHLQHRLGTVLGSLEEPLRKPRPQGPSLHKHPAHTGEPFSCLARQQHLFVLYTVLTAQQNEHTLNDRSAPLKRGLGATENATQSPLCANGTKEPVRVENETTGGLHRHLGVADLQQVMWSLITCFPWSLNLNVDTPKCE